MGEAQFQIIYDGDALASGQMDVNDLAPALLAVGDLFQEANRIFNGQRAEVSVKVSSEFKRGSFGVNLELMQGLYQQIQGVLLNDPIKTATQILDTIGIWKGAVGTAGISLFALMRWLRGRRIESSTVLDNGRVRIEINNSQITGSVIEVHPDVVKLYNDDIIRRATTAIVKPLEKPGITVLETRKDGTVQERITKEEALDFRASSEVEPTKEEKSLLQSEREAIVEVTRPSFENKLKWSLSDGSSSFQADMEDKGFLEKIERKEISFTKGDLLKVKLLTKQTQITGGLRTENVIIEVIDTIPAMKQLPLIPVEPKK